VGTNCDFGREELAHRSSRALTERISCKTYIARDVGAKTNSVVSWIGPPVTYTDTCQQPRSRGAGVGFLSTACPPDQSQSDYPKSLIAWQRASNEK
jgi:hypothetical protein